MANIEIRTNNPQMALAISEGANAVELKAVRAECARLQAVNGVRAVGDQKRWYKTRKILARKYTVKPVGRARGAILGVYGLFLLGVHGWYEYFRDWNREV